MIFLSKVNGVEKYIMEYEQVNIEQLVDQLCSADEYIVRQAAFYLVPISRTPENQIKIREAGGIDSLVKILINGSGDNQDNAISILANLAFNVENRTAIRVAGGITAFMTLLSVKSGSFKLRGVKSLVELAKDTDNQIAIRNEGGLLILINLLSDSSDSVKKYAAFVLTNLSHDSLNIAVIRGAGAIETLVGLLNHMNNDVTAACAGLLAVLATDYASKCMIVEEGAIDILISLLSNTENAVLRNAAGALCNLSSDSQKNQGLIGVAQAIGPLVVLLANADFCVMRYACGALSNLSQNTENMDKFRTVQCIALLVELLAHPDDSVKSYSLIMLGNLANDAGYRVSIRDEGGILPIIDCLTNPDTDVKYKAAGALRNLALDVDNRCIISEAGGVVHLVTLLKNAESLVRKHSTWALMNMVGRDHKGDNIINAGGLPLLTALLGELDVSVRRYAAGAIQNMAYHRSNWSLIRSAGAVAPLAALCVDTDSVTKRFAHGALENLKVTPAERHVADIQNYIKQLNSPAKRIKANAAMFIANFSNTAENQLIIQENGGVASVVELLKEPDSYFTKCAVGTLMNLIQNADFCGELYKLGGIELVCALLIEGQDKEITKYTITILNKMTLDNKGFCAVIKACDITQLVSLLRSDDASLRLNSSALIFRLLDSRGRFVNGNISNKIREVGGIHLLASMLHDTNDCRKNALLILTLLAIQPNYTAMNEAGCVQVLVGMINDCVEAEAKSMMVYILSCLSEHAKSGVDIIEVGGISLFVSLLASTVSSLCGDAAYALGNLANINSVIKTKISAVGGVTAIVDLLGRSEKRVLRHASNALITLSANDLDNKIAMKNAGVFEKITALLSGSSLVSAEWVDSLIRENLARLALNITIGSGVDVRSSMRAVGCVKPLVELAKIFSGNTALWAAQTLCYHLRDSDGVTEIVRARGVEPLVPFLGHSDRCMRNIAVISLSNLVSNSENKLLLRSAGAIVLLVKMLADVEGDDEVKKCVRSALESLNVTPSELYAADQALLFTSNQTSEIISPVSFWGGVVQDNSYVADGSIPASHAAGNDEIASLSVLR